MKKRNILLSLFSTACGALILSQTAFAGFDWSFFAPAVTSDAAVVSPKAGDIIYDNGTTTFKGYNGTNWLSFAAASQPPLTVVQGNAGNSVATPSDDVILLSGSSFNESIYTANNTQGKVIILKHNDLSSLTNVYTLVPQAGESINGITAPNYYRLYTNGETVKLVSDGVSNWVVVEHDTSTDWVNAGTLTIDATTTGPTKNSLVAVDEVWWRRVGSSAEIRMNFVQSGTGTGGTGGNGDYLFKIPSNMTIDTSKMAIYTTLQGSAFPTQIFGGVGYGSLGFPTIFYSGNATVYDTTHLRVMAGGVAGSSGGGGALGSARTAFGNSALGLNINAVVPIAGWQP